MGTGNGLDPARQTPGTVSGAKIWKGFRCNAVAAYLTSFKNIPIHSSFWGGRELGVCGVK